MTYEECIGQSLLTKLKHDARHGAEDLIANSFIPSVFPGEFDANVFDVALWDAIRSELSPRDSASLAATLRQIAEDLDEPDAFFGES